MKKILFLIMVGVLLSFIPVMGQKQSTQKEIIKLNTKIDSLENTIDKFVEDQQKMTDSQVTIVNRLIEMKEDYSNLLTDYHETRNWLLGVVALIVGALGVGAPLLLNRQANKKYEELIGKIEKDVAQISEIQSRIDEIQDKIEKSEKRAEDSRKRSFVNSLLSEASNEKNPHEAIRVYSRIIHIDPKNVRAYLNRASLYIDDEEAYALAKRDMDIVITMQPQNYLAYMIRGRANSLLGNYNDAINDANMSVSLNPQDPKVFEYRAIVNINASKWKNAIADYDKVFKLGKVDKFFYNNRAYAYMRIKKLDLALADVNDAIRLDNNSAEFYDTRGAIYFRKGEDYYDSALEDFSKAILLNPRLWETYENRSNLYKAMSDITDDQAQKKLYLKLRGEDLLVYRKKDLYFAEKDQSNIGGDEE